MIHILIATMTKKKMGALSVMIIKTIMKMIISQIWKTKEEIQKKLVSFIDFFLINY